MQYLTDNTRIKGLLEVTPPIKLIDKLPLSSKASKLVYESRNELSSILKQEDDRLLVVVGPCSIHDPKAAIEYAQKLKPLADALSKELKIALLTDHIPIKDVSNAINTDLVEQKIKARSAK